MLSRFKIKNFRSIVELEVDMSYGEGKAPNGYRTSQTHCFFEAKKKRYIPCLAFYGANASGKTNIIKAMKCFKDIVLTELNRRLFDPNRLNPLSDTTVFELEAVLENRFLQYTIEYDAVHIKKEELLCDGETVFCIEEGKLDFSRIATKTYPKKILDEIYTTECNPDKKAQFRTFLSVIGNRLPGLNENILLLYRFFKRGVLPLTNNEPSMSEALDLLAELFKTDRDPLQSAFDIIQKNLKKLDIDIERIDLQRSRETLDGQVMPDQIMQVLQRAAKIKSQNHGVIVSSDQFISWRKNIHGELVDFDFDRAESQGTQILARLVGVLHYALETGSIVMVDELDKSLHPFLLAILVRRFKDKHLNKNHAQLIFTAYDVSLLENHQLRVSEVGIVEKTLKRGTTVMRLCEDESLRNVSNFKQLYLDGVYGGIPFPYG